MKVLFVDDEPRVLEALERSLFQLDVDWNVTFAEGGQAALRELAAARFDVVVSDMRMPGMDGAALLSQVCKKYPHVVRIVLSGQTDEAEAFRAVRVAHQFLAKPFSSEALRQVIERARLLMMGLGDERLQAIVGRLEHLPSAPQLMDDLTRALEDEATTAETLAAIVRQDPAMSSKVLQLVNSSFFSNGASISDIRAAVVRLGTKTVRALATRGGAFAASTKPGELSSASVATAQLRSLATARVASRIAKDKVDPAAAFAAGLLCDVGELILSGPMSHESDGSEGEHRQRDALKHAEVGAFFLGLWGLPFPIVEAVANHHAPSRTALHGPGLPQVVWLAACLVNGNEPDTSYLRHIGFEGSLSDYRAMTE